MEVVEGAGEEELGQVAMHTMTKMTVMIMISTMMMMMMMLVMMMVEGREDAGEEELVQVDHKSIRSYL